MRFQITTDTGISGLFNHPSATDQTLEELRENPKKARQYLEDYGDFIYGHFPEVASERNQVWRPKLRAAKTFTVTKLE